MRLIFSFLFIISFFAQTKAQVQKTGTDFLATAKKSRAAVSADEKINFLRDTDHTLPFVQQLELRTETHDFQLTEQGYSLRFTPNSPKQRRAQDNYHQAFIRNEEADKQEFLLDELEEKYATLVDYHFITGLIKDKEDLKKLYTQKQKTLRALVSSPNFNITNFIETEEDIFELESELLELTQKKNTINEALNLALETETLQTNFIDLNQILLTIRDKEAPIFLANEAIQLRQNLIQKEYEKEITEINNPIDFIQAQYGGSNADELREQISIGVGIRLPFKGDKKLDLLELDYEKLERNANFQIELTEKKERITTQVKRIENFIEQYNLLQKQTEDNQVQYALAQLKKMPDASPLQIIRMEEILLKKRSQIYRLEHRIFQEYADWLHLTETTISLPLRNHLSKDTSIF
ncbi:MAG: hypothetical protein ACI85O_003595 [Saprospiraceae bacterium]|jgi:hypothetical protein